MQVSLLEQKTIKKSQIYKNMIELNVCCKSQKYKIEIIKDSFIYANKLNSSQLLDVNSWAVRKKYSKEENI